MPANAEDWVVDIEALTAGVLLVGHSHVPFLRKIGDKVLLNPGSLGQPRAGKALASYAVWRDGAFELKTFHYPVEATVEKLKVLALPADVEAELANILKTGSV